METLIYDIEVFRHNSMVVFKNLEGETVRVFSSHLDGLGSLIDRGLITGSGYDDLKDYIRGKTLVGYNNYFYDDYMLQAMTQEKIRPYLKDWNDQIIKKRSTTGLLRISVCETLDCFQQINVSSPSLKKIEGNMGSSIVESSVPFDIERKLTPAENYETFLYCEHDVEQTLEIYKLRRNYFSTKEKLVEMLGDADGMLNPILVKKWNTTSIVGKLLDHSGKKRYRMVSDDMLDHVPDEVQEMWLQLDSTMAFKFKKKKVVVEDCGCVFEFGWGGLHGVPRGPKTYENVRLADVASMYPSILIHFRGLGEKTEIYKKMKEDRIKLKHTNKAMSDVYKLILNSTYGLLNNKYSVISNPYLAYSICMYGQISIYVLAKRLQAIGAEIVNVNTDGVAYVFNGYEDEAVKKEWEEEFSLNLETVFYDKWFQVDVNNYIATREREGGKKEITAKGGDVNKFHEHQYFSNNDCRICQIALVEYIVNGKPVIDTIRENLNDPILYQFVLSAGSTYQGVVTTDEPEVLLTTKINRVFASKEGVEIVKKRQDGGTVKFADAPSCMYVYNDDLKDFDNFHEIVDLQYYYDLTVKNLKRWSV